MFDPGESVKQKTLNAFNLVRPSIFLVLHLLCGFSTIPFQAGQIFTR